MREKSILTITLACLSLFGLRSILPDISSLALNKFNAVYANSHLIASVVDAIKHFVS